MNHWNILIRSFNSICVMRNAILGEAPRTLIIWPMEHNSTNPLYCALRERCNWYLASSSFAR